MQEEECFSIVASHGFVQNNRVSDMLSIMVSYRYPKSPNTLPYCWQMLLFILTSLNGVLFFFLSMVMEACWSYYILIYKIIPFYLITSTLVNLQIFECQLHSRQHKGNISRNDSYTFSHSLEQFFLKKIKLLTLFLFLLIKF